VFGEQPFGCALGRDVLHGFSPIFSNLSLPWVAVKPAPAKTREFDPRGSREPRRTTLDVGFCSPGDQAEGHSVDWRLTPFRSLNRHSCTWTSDKEIELMSFKDKNVVVTGGNRGIGQALVEEALRRGAKRVYAGTRQPMTHSDRRVTPLTLDVTNAAQIQAAVGSVESLDILINNAGVALYDDLSDRTALEQSLAVNLFGTYGVTRAFLPLLVSSRGAIVNNVSMMAFAPIPITPAYAVSKAAAFSLTQSLRALLAGQGVRVHAVLTGPTDTDMTRGFEIPKASPQSVARAIFDGVENGDEDIFPDPVSESLIAWWRGGVAKALEHQYAALVGAGPAKSAA
jgi:NAD(P)-dependent dehydrogenase (short-subunit alcohol dehydrogenase family)